MYIESSILSQASIPIILGVLVISYLFYSVCVAIYNITLHPLARFPGPKLRGAFEFPDAYAIFSGYRERRILALHKRFGPVVRISPYHLSFTSAQAWKDIYGFRPGKELLQKDPRFYSNQTQDQPVPSIIEAGGAAHTKIRRLLSNAFSDNALRGQEEILNQYFELLVSRLKEEVDGPDHGKVDMVGWYNWTTFDVIGDLALGESFHALENRDYHPWIKNIFLTFKFGRIFIIGGTYPWINKLIGFFVKMSPAIAASRREHLNYVREKTRARLSDFNTDRNDFINYILRGKEDRALNHDEIMVNSNILIIAGSETTATALSGLTFYLLSNPEKLARLQREVRGAFTSAQEMNLLSVRKLPYLQAVLEESMRMYGPVSTILPRLTGPAGDTIDGIVVPGRMTVGVHQWSASYSASNWADPTSFVPERWLNGVEVPEKYRNDKRESIQPFSTGPRNCLGKNLAYNELRAIVARLMWHFDMELLPESRNWADQQAWVFWQKPRLYVQLRHRKMV